MSSARAKFIVPPHSPIFPKILKIWIIVIWFNYVWIQVTMVNKKVHLLYKVCSVTYKNTSCLDSARAKNSSTTAALCGSRSRCTPSRTASQASRTRCRPSVSKQTSEHSTAKNTHACTKPDKSTRPPAQGACGGGRTGDGGGCLLEGGCPPVCKT